MKIDKKIKCIHCDDELIMDNLTIESKCTCGKLVLTNGLITEGEHGTDWIDISPVLLNE